MNVWLQISATLTGALDYLLGWLLYLPRDAAIVAVALATSLLLTLVRKWCTDQDLLARCAADLRQLQLRIRGAKAARDRSSVRRHKETVNLIKLRQLAAEGRVLIWSLVPLVLLATWALERLDYLPPQIGKELTLRAYFPLSSENRRTHLVPPEGFQLRSPAVQLAEKDADGQNCLASWILVAERPIPPTGLIVRHQERSVEHVVHVDGRRYAPPLCSHSEPLIPVTEISLPQARFLGIVPGVPALGLPPFVVAYLLLALGLVYPLRRVLRVW